MKARLAYRWRFQRANLDNRRPVVDNRVRCLRREEFCKDLLVPSAVARTEDGVGVNIESQRDYFPRLFDGHGRTNQRAVNVELEEFEWPVHVFLLPKSTRIPEHVNGQYRTSQEKACTRFPLMVESLQPSTRREYADVGFLHRGALMRAKNGWPLAFIGVVR